MVVHKESADSRATTVASIKINVNGQTELTAGEGDGPVDALNDALRKVLRRFYPAVDEWCSGLPRAHSDPKWPRVRPRVLIDLSDGQEHWGTVGVSANIIEACGRRW